MAPREPNIAARSLVLKANGFSAQTTTTLGFVREATSSFVVELVILGFIEALMKPGFLVTLVTSGSVGEVTFVGVE